MAKKDDIEIPVTFKSCTFGDKIVSIGISTSRTARFGITKADAALTEKRLTLTMYAGAGDVSNGQTSMVDDGDIELTGIFDTSGLASTTKKFGATLSAPITSIDENMIKKFAKRQGRLVISKIEAGDGEGE